MALGLASSAESKFKVIPKSEPIVENGETKWSPIYEIITATSKKFFFRETAEGIEFGATIESMRIMNIDQMYRVLLWADKASSNNGVTLH